MSQSNDSLAHCAVKRGGIAKPPFLCAILFVQEDADRRKRTSR